MSAATDWTAARCAGAPAPLAERVLRWVDEATPGDDPPAALAAAAERALQRVAAGPPGRESAADVLAADALVTLALLAQAERDPAGLAPFAEALRVRVAGQA